MFTPEYEPYEDVGVLEFRLENGMGQLETLQQLAHLHFDSESDAYPLRWGIMRLCGCYTTGSS